MTHRMLFFASAALLLLCQSAANAGGPPWVCLPIDGVTRDDAQQCVELVNAKLDSKLWPEAGLYRDVRVDQRQDQWYLTFGIGQDVRLGDVEAALKGSTYSIPRDKLRLFGHVILEVKAPAASHKALLDALAELENTSVAATDEQGELLLVTMEMPYPATDGRLERGSVGWDAFRKNDYSTEQPTTDEPTTTSAMLPGYDSIIEIAARHKASLTDLRWSTNFSCRALGGVAVQGTSASPGSAVQAVAAQ